MILYFYLNDQPYIAKEQFAPQARSARVFYQKDKNNKSIIALIHQSNLAKDKISMSSFHKDDMYVYLEEEKLIFPVSAFTGCVNRHYTL